jgi:hypothetical protein
LGGIITLLVLLPNLLAVFFPPADWLTTDPQPDPTRLKIMTVLERTGQIGSFTIPFFYRLSLTTTAQAAALAVMVGALALYYAGWIRYLHRGLGEAWFYRPLLGIPIPMAVMPVIYFLAASVLLGSGWLTLAAAVLGVGHISVTWLNSQGIEERGA